MPIDPEALKARHAQLSPEAQELVGVLLRHAREKDFTSDRLAAVMTESRDFVSEISESVEAEDP